MSESYEYSLLKPILQVKDVCLSFREKKVLNHLSFDILDVHRPGYEQGQIVSILGPSGVGKSQLFRRIAGLDVPDSGQILVGLDAKPTHPGMVGVVFQDYRILNHRTVLSNLVIAGVQAGLKNKEAHEKAREMLKTFSLEDKEGSWPAELSGGQKQRVAIAQQLMCSEHFLLMDEPTTGLDPIMKSKTCDLILHVASLHEENTIIMVSHDIESAVKISDQIIVLGHDPKDKKSGAVVRANIDLKERGIAWRENNESLPVFSQTVREIKSLFPSL